MRYDREDELERMRSRRTRNRASYDDDYEEDWEDDYYYDDMREAAGGAMRLPIAGIREKPREADTEAITASRIGKGVMGTPRDAEARPVRAAAVSRKDREMGGERKARKS